MRRRDNIPVQVGPRQDWRTIATLTPYLWPRGEAELRLRVVVSVVLLVAAKVATVSVPVILKHAVDALTVAPGKVVAAILLGSALLWAFAAPPVIFGISIIGALGVALGLALAAHLLYLVWRA